MAQHKRKNSGEDLAFESVESVVIQEDHNLDEGRKEFHLHVANDGLVVLLDCTVSGQEIEGLLTRIKNELSSLGVANPPTHEQLEGLLRRAARRGVPLANEVLAQGETPVPPKDGILTWTLDFFGAGFGVDEKTGSVDYRQRDKNRVVEKGQLLARLAHPEEGQPGCDVFGNSIPTRSPKKDPICAGSNVRVEEKSDARCFFADIDGRIRFTGGTLAVDDVYTIHGDVCMGTGHINHPGALVVEGDVLAGFKVHAEGNIEIRGIVEPADIQAGGDLIVHGGITGAEGQSIKVWGSVEAKYILDADIEAGGDIVVKSEIIHSTLKTRGAVVMPAGRLIGGEVSALGGVVVGQAGSDAHVPTLIVAAEDHGLAEKLHTKQKEIESLVESWKKIHEKVDPLMSREETLTPKQKDIATELLENASKMEEETARLRTEMEGIKAESRERAKPLISIRNKLYSETTLRIKEVALLVDETCHGPVQARLRHGKIVLNAI